MNNVITVDFRAPDAPKLFQKSIKETGFGVITHHPIAPSLMQNVYDEWAAFFSSPNKFEHTFDPSVQAGYFPVQSENAKDQTVKDLKEFYHYYPWHNNPASVSVWTPKLHRQMLEVATTLLNWIEQETPPEVSARFTEKLSHMIVDSPKTLFRAIHYPPLNKDDPKGSVRAAAHEDINLLTLLPAATQPGLEVQDVHGHWHKIDCDPGTLVVNSADMLHEASGGYYPSTTHRVVNPTQAEQNTSRYSVPLFLHARSEVRLSERYTAGQYLDQRLAELGLK